MCASTAWWMAVASNSPGRMHGCCVIGGRVLDESFLIAFASRTSVYAEAAVWTAVDRSVVLVVPSSVVAVAAAQLTIKDAPVLEVLLALPVLWPTN